MQLGAEPFEEVDLLQLSQSLPSQVHVVQFMSQIACSAHTVTSYKLGQAMRLAISKGLTQEAIEVTIQAAKRTIGTHIAPLAGEGSGSTTTGTTDGQHLRGIVTCLDISGSSDNEELHRQAPMKHFNRLSLLGFNSETTTVKTEEWLC